MIDEFLEDIHARGVAYGNRFFCEMRMPEALLSSISQAEGGKQLSLDMRELMLRCDTAELPGVQFVTSDNKVMGPIYKVPNQILYNDITLSYMLSADLAEKYLFDFWMNEIKDDSDTYKYYEQYTSEMQIRVYNMRHEPVYGIKFHKLYPTAINQIQLSWQDSEIMRLSVTFAFERWEPIAYNVANYSFADALSQSDLGLGIIRDFVFGVLPSIPGAQRAVGNPIVQDLLNGRGLNSSQMIRQGAALIAQKQKGKDPLTNTLIGAGMSTFQKIIGGR